MRAPVDRDMPHLLLPFEVRLEGETAGLQRPRLASDIIGGGGEAAPPMIKHTRDVIDSIRLLDDAEEEIVVLGAIKLRAETADLPLEIPPDEREMADIVTGEKIVRGPIRFKDRRIEALLRELIFIGIN